MSDEESIAVDTSSSGPQMLHAEYKDGQLQIVEVTPFDRDKPDSILPDLTTDGEQQKYLQVLDPNKGLVQLDLLNLTLVRCEDGEESYRLVTNSEDTSDIPADATVTCVLQSSDGEEHDSQDYVMVDGDQGLVFLQSSCDMDPQPETSQPEPAVIPQPEKKKPNLTPQQILDKAKALQKANSWTFQYITDGPHSETSLPSPTPQQQKKPKKKLTPQQILDKEKALQKAKALIQSQMVRPGKRGRRPAGDLPPPHELLASPNFKLYLYSCKLCSFKCNAIKQLQAHRAAEHGGGGGGGKARAGGVAARAHYAALQCARCPFRAASNAQLMKHVQAKHLGQEEAVATESITFTNKVSLDSKEVEEADVLVCGACGYESGERDAFRRHIEIEHGATAT